MTTNICKCIIVMLSIWVIFPGCKRDSSKALNPGSKQVQKHITDNYYKNSSNPYDEIGQRHNDGLDFIYASHNNWGNPVDATLYAEAIRYGVEVLGYSHDVLTTLTDNYISSMDNYMHVNNDEFDLAINNMIRDWNASDRARDLMDNLFSSVLNSSSTATVEGIVTNIKSIENEIGNSNGLTNPEKKSLYMAASILRHSLYYWNTNPPTEWSDDTPPMLFKKIREWIREHQREIKIACADAAIIILAPTPLGVAAGILTSISVS